MPEFTPSERPSRECSALDGKAHSRRLASDARLLRDRFGRRGAAPRAIVTLGAFPEPADTPPGDHNRRNEAVAFTRAVRAALD